MCLSLENTGKKLNGGFGKLCQNMLTLISTLIKFYYNVFPGKNYKLLIKMCKWKYFKCGITKLYALPSNKLTFIINSSDYFQPMGSEFHNIKQLLSKAIQIKLTWLIHFIL